MALDSLESHKKGVPSEKATPTNPYHDGVSLQHEKHAASHTHQNNHPVSKSSALYLDSLVPSSHQKESHSKLATRTVDQPKGKHRDKDGLALAPNPHSMHSHAAKASIRLCEDLGLVLLHAAVAHLGSVCHGDKSGLVTSFV